MIIVSKFECPCSHLSLNMTKKIPALDFMNVLLLPMSIFNIFCDLVYINTKLINKISKSINT